MSILAMNSQRKLILGAALIGVISVFLPWITVSVMGMGNSQNGFRGAGIVVFLAFAAAGLITLMGDQNSKLPKTMWIAALAAGVAAFLFTVISFGSSGEGDALGLVESGYGIGIWLALLASIAVLLFAWIHKNPGDDLKSGIESLKTGSFSFSSGSKSQADEIERLARLRSEGKISESEYQRLKSKIIDTN